MYCDVCRNALAGIWDPSRTPRVAALEDFMASVNGPVPEQPLVLEKDERICSTFVYGLHAGEPSPDCEICGVKVKQFNLRNFQASYFEILEFSTVFYLLFDDGWKTRKDPVLDPVVKIVIVDQDGGVEKQTLMSASDSEMREQIPQWLDRTATGWTRMDTWLNTCLDSHTRCALITTAKSYRPTRLLKLGSDTWRIVLSQDVPVAFEYVALSYCWGTGSTDGVLMLLDSNREQMGQAQPINVLPQTFKDAVGVVMHFGIHYLWIDRLCIVQDSRDDWAFEASRMMDVYQNAKFSIAALHAADADAGLSRSRNPDKHLAVDLDLQPREDGTLMPYVSAILSSRAFIDMEFGPLWNRGWVVQERLLARRTIYFGNKQIYWECHESHCCEILPLGTFQARTGLQTDWTSYNKIRDLLPMGSFPWKPLISASAGAKQVTTAYNQIFLEWNSIVLEYSFKNLTYSSDKLVAISGVAQAVKSVLQQIDPHRPHRYLFGHWEENILESITWRAQSAWRKDKLGSALEQPIAPSWAWSRIGFRIFELVLEPHSEICATVKRIEVDIVSANATGNGSSAELTLEAPHSTMSVTQVPSDYHNLQDDQLTSKTNGGEVVITRGPEGEENVYIVMDVRDEQEPPSDVIWIAIVPIRGRQKSYEIRGLVLAATEEDQFRRLGVIFLIRDTKQSCLDFIKHLDKKTFRII